jgi:GT2 family glycosyltransferase
MTTAVVILNYNGFTHLERYLPSVLEFTPLDIEIIVADNASTDNSIELLKSKKFERINIIQLEKNTGFAQGYNNALSKLKHNHWILLNSDVEVTPNWTEPLIKKLQENNIATVQPKILSFTEKNKFEHAGASGGFIDIFFYPFCRGRIFNEIEIDNGQYDSEIPIAWTSGAAMAINRIAFESAGGFDGDYFAHMEEIDLCLRLQKMGYSHFVTPGSVVYHLGGGTLDYNSSKKVFLNFRNSLFTIIKNEKSFNLIWKLPVRLLLDGVAGILFITQGKWRNTLAIIQAHWTFFFKSFYWIKKRNHYKNLIQMGKIGQELKLGHFPKSIVFSHYSLKIKKFKDIVW